MHRNLLAAVSLTAAVSLPSLASASYVTLRRDTVLQIVIDDTLSIRSTHRGDRFGAHVEADRDLPRGTQLVGEVLDVREARSGQPAMMDLRFREIVMPDGYRTEFDGVPISLSDKSLTRDQQGRIVAKVDYRKKENTVLGGAIGGFILGSVFHKQFEGIVLGTVAGIIIAESGNKNDQNTVLQRGQKMGALVRNEVSFDWTDQGYAGNSRDGDDRGDATAPWRNAGDRYNHNNGDRGNRNEQIPDDRTPDDRRPETTNIPPVATQNDTSRQSDPVFRPIPVISCGSRDLAWADEAKPYRVGEVIMVPLTKAASQMGLRVSREDMHGGRVIVESEDNYLQMELTSTRAKINGRPITLSQAAVEKEDVVYVPVDVLAQITKDIVYLDGKKIQRAE